MRTPNKPNWFSNNPNYFLRPGGPKSFIKDDLNGHSLIHHLHSLVFKGSLESYDQLPFANPNWFEMDRNQCKVFDVWYLIENDVSVFVCGDYVLEVLCKGNIFQDLEDANYQVRPW